jgi:hypothetical protein
LLNLSRFNRGRDLLSPPGDDVLPQVHFEVCNRGVSLRILRIGLVAQFAVDVVLGEVAKCDPRPLQSARLICSWRCCRLTSDQAEDSDGKERTDPMGTVCSTLLLSVGLLT